MTRPRRCTIDIRAMLSVVEAAPMSRSQIARATGLSPATITRLANGERGRRPSFETVDQVRGLFDAICTGQALTTVKR